MLKLVSGVGSKGAGYLTLVGSKHLGPDGAAQLAVFLGEAPSLLLASLDLRREITLSSLMVPVEFCELLLVSVRPSASSIQ